MSHTLYRRTPLPRQAETPLGWLFLCLAGVIFSPFVGFAIHGKVAQDGVVIGLVFALLPLSGLALIAWRRAKAWRALPPDIAAEWSTGKRFPADGAPTVPSPARFAGKKDRIEISTEGVTLFKPGVMSVQGIPEALGKMWVAEHTGTYFVAWNMIEEWIVECDSDGPDYFLLKLRPSGSFRVRRFRPNDASEADILDAVRSIGKVPVRLRCDVD